MSVATVAVVIVNYRSSHLIGKCLESLIHPCIGEIIIFENGSGEDEYLALTKLSKVDPRLRLYKSDTNLGFAGGVNAATREIKDADLKFIWILNPDTVSTFDAPYLLSQALAVNEFDIVSPVVTQGDPANPKIWFAGGSVDARAGVSTHHGFGMALDDVPGENYSTGFISGAALMIVRGQWYELGGLREDFFLYWEDADFSLRARKLGLKLGVVPAARVWHMEGGSSKHDNGLSATYYYYMQRNRVALFSTESSMLNIMMGRGLLQTVRLLAKPLIKERVGKVAKFRASVKGVSDALLKRNGQRNF